MTQQHTTPFWRNTLHTLAVSAMLACTAGTTQAQTNAPAGATPSLRPGEPVTLNFSGADIEAVSRAIGAITNRNVVVDPRVKGQITLLTDRPVPPATAYQQFLAALRLQGFTIVESAGLYKVIPEADAKLQASEVAVGASRSSAGSQIVTQIFKLNYENAANLVPVLRPLISPNNTINVNPGNNSLVITDYADNLQRISRIVATMDVSNATDVEIIPLRHAVATDMVALVSRLIEGGTASPGGLTVTAGGANIPGQSDNAFKTSLMAEPRSNSIVLRAANPARLAQVRSLIARLDQPAMNGGGDQGNIHVVYLKNADAVALAATLRAAIGAQATAAGTASGQPGAGGTTPQGGGMSSIPTSQPVVSRDSSGTASMGMGSSSGLGSSGGGGALGVAQQPSTGGMVQADPSTNSLIITAPPPIYRQMRAVIDKLDGRRAQVLIESLIVELKDNRLAQFGVQWQAILSNNGKVLGSIGNNSSVAGANILSLLNAFNKDGSINTSTGGITGDTVSSMRGTNLGFTQSVNGNTTLGFLANFLQNSGDANILSTPNLMTLDNEEARIIVGQNVPMVTGSYASNSTGGTVNPFTTVERKDVGLMLRVRPQINENGTVKLAVFQEVSSVDESTRKDTNGLTTNKRSIESNVLVEDGNIIVLGGLIDDNYSQAEDRIPLLGDIPVLGNLFRNTNRKRNKTNLMVFLRPVVMRDAAATNQVSSERYEAIRAQQQGLQPEQNVLLRSVNAAPVLPTLTPQPDPGSFTNPAAIVNVPGAKPELIDFTQPQPAAPAVPAAPGAL
ncbi:MULTISPECIES: type II secretion system secretin GspD [unclassified Delftia]|uniref:type II secretion system secretin GspD n=1 Tax=unclassified Delftia TaxID=2613839 RepID=UPI0018FF7698|nr:MULTISPECIES: type II secretion system secretin GspD [unclassified Delftia]MBK0111473.1 type II secretion system secretin GspD [Delftia sp. S65]MBK0116708.1 type II secretion system secretin GspD [Delftia sp. S67]MBK0128191.1 type II secretion system secretin GspD [Delftia sp. S66]